MKTHTNSWKILTFICCLLCLPITGIAKKSKKTLQSVKAETPYEKLLKDKQNYPHAHGLMNLFWMKEKLYMEIPKQLLNRTLLTGTMVYQVSNMQESSVGYRPDDPIAVSFIRSDSVLRLYQLKTSPLVQSITYQPTAQRSFAYVLIEQFPIKAYSPDSAMVVDISSLLLKDQAAMSPIDPKGFNHMDGWIKRKPSFKKERSTIVGIQAYNDCISISFLLSYDLSISLLGVFPVAENIPFTALTKRYFMVLPETDYKPRMADARVGTQQCTRTFFSNEEQGSRELHWVNRWNLENKESLVFYVDTLLPESWKRSVERSAARWNEAFRELGYNQVIQLKPFPKDATSVDVNSLAHSSIRYVTSPAGELSHQLWSSPFTGEILSATIFIPHNLAATIQRHYFLQTSSFNQKARTLVPDESLVEEALTSQLLKQWGYCLGLTDNMAGSYTYPVDSLQSSTFVKCHGLSASVMDALPMNYLLDESSFNTDVPLTQQVLGAYDKWALRYLYQRYPGKSPIEEREALRKLVKERNSNPLLLFKQVQSKKAYYDPRGMENDLGNDAVRSASIAFRNLAKVIQQANGWLDCDDKDYAMRFELYGHLINQADEHVKHVLQQVGGIYLNEKYQGDSYPFYQVVDKEVQRKSLCWMLETIEKMEWMDQKDLLNHTGLVGSAADYAQKFFGNLVLVQLNNLWLSESKADNPYTQQQAVDDVMDFAWKESRIGKVPSSFKRFMQSQLVQQAIALSNVETTQSEKKNTKKSANHFPYYSQLNRDAFWYGVLLQLQTVCQSTQRVAPTQALKDEAAYFLFLINRALNKDVSKYS